MSETNHAIWSNIDGDTAIVEIQRVRSADRLKWAVIKTVLAVTTAAILVAMGIVSWNVDKWEFVRTATLIVVPAVGYVAHVVWHYVTSSYGSVRLVVDPTYVTIEHRLGNRLRRRTFERALIAKAWLVLSYGSRYLYLLYNHGDVRLFRYHHKDEALAMMDALTHSAGVPQA